MLENIKIGNKLLVINKNGEEVNSTVIDIINDNIVVDINGDKYIAEQNSENMWFVPENSEEINESLLRDNSKRQMKELNKTIKKAGGDIQDIVRRSEKTKEDKMPNAYYMDNPFDTKRKSIQTWEEFTKGDAHYKSVAMKSRDPKPNRPHTDSKLSTLKMNETIESGSLKTMNAHFQTFVYPYLPKEEQVIIKKLDIILFRYNYDKDVNVRLSFKSPQSREDSFQLMLINISPDIYNDILKIITKFGLNAEYDNKNKMYLDIFYKKEKGNRKINESKKSSEVFIPIRKLKNLKNFYQVCKDGDCVKKSDVNDDSWVKGTKEELNKPMFKNLPDNNIRPSYDTLRAGKWITLFGQEGRVNGIKNGQLLFDIVEDDKPKTVKYDLKDVMKEIRKTNKKQKK